MVELDGIVCRIFTVLAKDSSPKVDRVQWPDNAGTNGRWFFKREINNSRVGSTENVTGTFLNLTRGHVTLTREGKKKQSRRAHFNVNN